MTTEQGDQIIALLEGITQRIDYLALGAQDSTECPHPEEKRVDLSTYGDRDHWVCRVCKFDNKQQS